MDLNVHHGLERAGIILLEERSGETASPPKMLSSHLDSGSAVDYRLRWEVYKTGSCIANPPWHRLLISNIGGIESSFVAVVVVLLL